MKFNFKKLASVAATAIMLSSTIAAAYPAPFVSNGAADAAVVYGANAALSDASAAIDLMNDLNSGVVSTGETTVTGGDFVKLERSSDLFNLGNDMDDFYSTLDEDELSAVLAAGTYSNDANDDFAYEQKIVLGSALNLTHFQDSYFNNDEPIIGFDLASGALIMNYTLEFSPDDADAGSTWIAGNNLETTDITILGRTYYLLSARNTSDANHKITLLDTANSAMVSEGVTSTITTEAGSYDVLIEYIDSDEVILVVDGVSTNKLTEGGVYKIADDVYIAVKSVLYDAKEAGISKAEISIGSGKILLENTAEVEINNVDVDDMKFSIVGSDDEVKYSLKSFITTSSGTKLDKIVLQWTLKDDNWIAPGTEMVMPGFETIKLSMGDFISPDAEITTLKGDSDSLDIVTTLTEGAVTLPLLYLNSSSSGIDGMGKKSKELLVTNDSDGSTTQVTFDLNYTLRNYFGVTWISGDDSESYVYKIGSIDDDGTGDNATTLDNLADDGKDIVLDEVGDYKDNGQVKFTLLASNDDAGFATVKATPTSGGAVYGDRLVTAAGLMFKLPVNNESISGTAPDGNINASNNETSWTMNFTESDKDDNVAAGKSFWVLFSMDGINGIESNTITSEPVITAHETTSTSDKWISYVHSDLATKLTQDKPSTGLNDLEIAYPGGESYAEVYISEAGAAVVGSADDSTVKVVVVKDSEASSVASKNLIVVGGSCINTVAAQILGSESPICGDAFSEATNVAAGQSLIKTVVSPLAADKVAMLVAGYDAEDTVDAVAIVKDGVDSTVGTSQVYPILS